MWTLAIVICVVSALILFQLYRMTKGFRQYTSRASQEAAWKHLYPVKEHQELVQLMLEGFSRSFLFPVTACWRFSPEDKLADVLVATDNNHTDHLQYDMFQVVLQDLGLEERPQFENVDLRTVAELLIAAKYNKA